MRFFTLTLALSFVSFAVSAVLFSQTDFSEIREKAKSTNYTFRFGSEEELVVSHQAFNPEGIEKILIKSSFSKIEIESGNQEKIFLDMKVPKSFSKKNEYEIADKTLLLDFEDSSSSKEAELRLNVPQKLLAALEVQIDMGSLSIKDFKGLDLGVEMAAGKLDMESVEFKRVDIKASAGDISVKGLKIISGDIDAAAGSIELEKVQSTEELFISAAAGDIEVEMDQEEPRLKINAVAGDIAFSLSQGLQKNFTFKNSTSVGDLDLAEGYSKQGDNAYIYGEGKGKVEVNTSFGSVTIH